MIMAEVAFSLFPGQRDAAAALAVGALTIWVFTGAVWLAGRRQRAMGPWIIASGTALVATMLVAALTWGATDTETGEAPRVAAVSAPPGRIMSEIAGTWRGEQDFVVINGYTALFHHQTVWVFAGAKLGPGGRSTGAVRVELTPEDPGMRSGGAQGFGHEYLSPTGPDPLTVLTVVGGASVILGYHGDRTVLFDLDDDTFRTP
jgi:hypothetical protein